MENYQEDEITTGEKWASAIGLLMLGITGWLQWDLQALLQPGAEALPGIPRLDPRLVIIGEGLASAFWPVAGIMVVIITMPWWSRGMRVFARAFGFTRDN